MKKDIYQTITDRIIAELEKGVRPWVQPWTAGHAAGPVSRPLRSTGQPYQGINVLTLWATAAERGYAAPIWMTFRQAKDLGAHVRKGETGSPVVYAGAIRREETTEDGEAEEREIPFLKGYTVFNVEQIEGLPAHYTEQNTGTGPEAANPESRIAAAEAFFAATGADIRHGGGAAAYSPTLDIIRMPPFETFRSAQAYYGTLAHECTHWTRHPSRLDRDFGRKRFGDQGYAMEELVAELGAAFLSADLGLEPRISDDHAPYIASWLQALRNDNRAIFRAASHAQRAADYLNALQSGDNQAAA